MRAATTLGAVGSQQLKELSGNCYFLFKIRLDEKINQALLAYAAYATHQQMAFSPDPIDLLLLLLGPIQEMLTRTINGYCGDLPQSMIG